MEGDEEEVMAVLKYDFPSKALPDIRIHGTYEVTTLTQARKMCETLNKDYGEGSHWVEPMNHTVSER